MFRNYLTLNDEAKSITEKIDLFIYELSLTKNYYDETINQHIVVAKYYLESIKYLIQQILGLPIVPDNLKNLSIQWRRINIFLGYVESIDGYQTKENVSIFF